MFSLFGRNAEGAPRQIVIVDIGTNSIGMALAALSGTGKAPGIIAEARIGMPFTLSRDTGALAGRTVAAVREGAGTIANILRARSRYSRSGRVSHTAVFLPAPWCDLSLTAVRVSYGEPTAVGRADIERLAADHFKNHRAKDGYEVIERRVAGIRLNGYAVPDMPGSATVEEIEVVVAVAEAPSRLVDPVREALHHFFGRHTALSFHSTSIALSHALSSVAPERHTYALCNSEGELAELLLVADHILLGVATSAAGAATFARTVAAHGALSPAEVPSALKLACREGSPRAEEFAPAIAAASSVCAREFRTAAAPLFAALGTPQTLYFIGGGEGAALFKEAVARAPSMRALFPAGVSLEAAPRAALGAPVREGDAFLALEALFAAALLG